MINFDLKAHINKVVTGKPTRIRSLGEVLAEFQTADECFEVVKKGLSERTNDCLANPNNEELSRELECFKSCFWIALDRRNWAISELKIAVKGETECSQKNSN